MFSEERYFVEYKKIRNRFRKYRYVDLFHLGLHHLHSPSKSSLQAIEKLPWVVMLLFKWMLLDDQYPNSRGKTVSQAILDRLLSDIHHLSTKAGLPSQYAHHVIFMRKLANQQILYQEEMRFTCLAREKILFSGLPEKHQIGKMFFNITGLHIPQYVELMAALLVQMHESIDDPLIKTEWFEPLGSKYPQEILERFFLTISKDLDDVRQALLALDNGRRLANEYYEVTPFVRFPLITAENDHLITSKFILYRCAESFVYDTLREWNADKFMAKFGRIFEAYVERVLKLTHLPYRTEIQLMQLLGPSGLQIDFLVEEESANIFIDAKGVEMSRKGQTTHSPSTIRSATKTSILKAIKQAHAVLKKMADSTGQGLAADKHNYLLIITYKEFFLRNGATYYDAVAKSDMDQIYAKHENYPAILAENIYFIAIDEFDILCQTIGSRKLSLAKILATFRANDSDPHTSKFTFRQRLSNLGVDPEIPEHLDVPGLMSSLELILDSAT